MIVQFQNKGIFYFSRIIVYFQSKDRILSAQWSYDFSFRIVNFQPWPMIVNCRCELQNQIFKNSRFWLDYVFRCKFNVIESLNEHVFHSKIVIECNSKLSIPQELIILMFWQFLDFSTIFSWTSARYSGGWNSFIETLSPQT